MEQDLQGTVYRSSRAGDVPCERMAVPHARRALDALIREQGAEVAGTPLGLALAARVAQDGATEVRAVPFGDPDGVMIRGAHGRFTGAAFRSVYRKGERR